MLNCHFQSKTNRDQYYLENAPLARGICVVNSFNQSVQSNNGSGNETVFAVCLDWLLIKGVAVGYVVYMAIVSKTKGLHCKKSDKKYVYI